MLTTPLVLSFALLIAGCGGGGDDDGGGSSPIGEDDPNSGGSGGESIGGGDDGSDPGGQNGENTGNDGGGVPDPQDDEVDPPDDEDSVDEVPLPGGGDNAVPLSGGREARVLATEGGPVIGVPGGTMGNIALAVSDPAGFVAYSGRYRTPAQRTLASQGLWAGPAREPRLLLGDNAEIDGLPQTVRFSSADAIDIASDGSLAALVTLEGSRDTSAIVTAASGGAPSLLVESGTTIGGLSAEKTIERFTALSRASGRTAFQASTGRRGSGLWIAGADGFSAVAEHRDREVNNAPRIGDCRVFLDSSGRSNAPAMLDDGTLVFQAGLDTYVRNEQCASGSAVLRYRAGTYSSVVKRGDIVPGTTESRFGDIALLGVTASDAVVVSAELETPTGGAGPDTRWSYWLFPTEGTARLIALQGEEVQLGDEVVTFSGRERSLDVNAAGQVAFRTTFDDRNGSAALFGGSPHQGQPHGAISAPGMSALTFVLDSTTPVPAPYLPSTFFSTIGRPSVDASGRVVFIGRVTDSELDNTVVDALWRADLEGNVVPLIDADDEAPVAGVRRPLTDLLQIDRFRADGLQVAPLANGGFLLANDFNVRRSDSLIYLGPEGGS